MRQEHWIILGLTAALGLTLLGVSLSSAPASKGYKWARRVFWSAALLLFSSALGGVGLNGPNLTFTTLLGLPGYCALTVLSRLM